MIGLILLAVGICAILSVVLYTLRTGISPAWTSRRVKQALIIVLPQETSGPVFELGCGWGTLTQLLTSHRPHWKIVGYELSPLPFVVSWLRSQTSAKVRIFRKDLLSQPLHGAGGVICYLYPGAMQRLRKKLEEELPANAWVISHTFAIPGWTPDKVVEVNDLYRTKIHIYRRNHRSRNSCRHHLDPECSHADS